MDSITHGFLQMLVEISYLFIAAQFLIAFYHSRNKQAKLACLLLVFIFVFCGATRLMSFLAIHSLVHDISMIVLPVISWAFVLLNKPKEIVQALKNE